MSAGSRGCWPGSNLLRARGTEEILRHESALLRQSIRLLQGADCQLFTGAPSTQTGVLSLRSPRFDCETLAARLGDRGICVRSGLHCAPLAHESAGTLESGTLRLSFSPLLDAGSVSKACVALWQLLAADS